MKFYSWKDIERCCLLNKQRWENDIDSIEVYPSEITVYKKEDMSHSISHVLKQVLNEHFDEQNSQVKLDIGNIRIPVYEQEFQGSWEKPILPLFRDILYRPASYPSQEPHPLPKPLIAFHSYKGGVGRTLSLIAFAKAWSAAFEDTDHAKLLIIDSDLEAPGLTWLQDKQFEEDTISYLDLLTLIQDNSDVNQLVDLVCAKLTTSTLSIETQTRTVEHFFIPTYRYEEQLLDLYATPESIVNGRNKEYILADVISGICARLGAAVCLVDLRAGISEFSSTLLLDSRVKKYLVTSTSTQSIRGTQMILKYLMRGLSIREDSILPEVFLTMVPDGLPSEEKNNMINELHQFYEQDQSGDEDSYFTDNVITELPFASELIHLTSMKQILNNLSGRDMYFRIQKLVDQNYFAEVHPLEEPMDEENRKDKLAKIHQLAEMQLTAEGNSKFEVLMTESLKFLGKKYSQTVPTTVIMGAKGAGKTFLYRKMAESKDWAIFCKELYGSALSAPDGYFLPIIATRNSNELIKTLGNCIQNLLEIFCKNRQNLVKQRITPHFLTTDHPNYYEFTTKG